MAIGLSGEPVPRGTASGDAVSRNSQRRRLRRHRSAPRGRSYRTSACPSRSAASWCIGKRNACHQRRHQLTVGVAADHRHVALLEPAGAAHVHSGGASLRIPWAFLRAARPAAGAYEHDIAGAHLDPRLLLPGFEIGRSRWRPKVRGTSRPSTAGCPSGCRARPSHSCTRSRPACCAPCRLPDPAR